MLCNKNIWTRKRNLRIDHENGFHKYEIWNQVNWDAELYWFRAYIQLTHMTPKCCMGTVIAIPCSTTSTCWLKMWGGEKCFPNRCICTSHSNSAVQSCHWSVASPRVQWLYQKEEAYNNVNIQGATETIAIFYL